MTTNNFFNCRSSTFQNDNACVGFVTVTTAPVNNPFVTPAIKPSFFVVFVIFPPMAVKPPKTPTPKLEMFIVFK